MWKSKRENAKKGKEKGQCREEKRERKRKKGRKEKRKEKRKGKRRRVGLVASQGANLLAHRPSTLVLMMINSCSYVY